MDGFCIAKPLILIGIANGVISVGWILFLALAIICDTFYIFRYGSSWGQRFYGLKLVCADGQQLGMGRIIGRILVKDLLIYGPFVASFLALEFFFIKFNRTGGDLLSVVGGWVVVIVGPLLAGGIMLLFNCIAVATSPGEARAPRPRLRHAGDQDALS